MNKRRKKLLQEIRRHSDAMLEITKQQAAIIENLSARVEASGQRIAFCSHALDQACGLKDASKCCIHAGVERKRAARRSWAAYSSGLN